MADQYKEVQQDIRNRFYTVIRDQRLNDESVPDRAMTTPLLERATRNICVGSLEELQQFTNDFKQFLFSGNLAFFPDTVNGETRMFLWVNDTVMWQEIAISGNSSLGSSPIIFKNNINVAETGAVIHNIKLNWEIDESAVFKMQIIDNGIGMIDNEVRELELSTENVYTDTTWTLALQNGRHSAVAKTSIVFRDKIYWGVSDRELLTDTEIKGLNNVLRADRHAVCSFDCDNTYMYVAIPKIMGVPKFIAYELWLEDFEMNEIPITNIHGQTCIYSVYRSKNKQNGSNISIAIF